MTELSKCGEIDVQPGQKDGATVKSGDGFSLCLKIEEEFDLLAVFVRPLLLPDQDIS